METLIRQIDALSGYVWGPVTLILLVGTGVYLTLGLRLQTIRKIGYAFRLMMQGRDPARQKGEGEITPFQALMTALSATIGTGNIAGVATAIFLGGPGALFWMWMTAIFGMATKFSECVLAVHYRESRPGGAFVGGPMYYIRHGMGHNWRWLGILFALFASVAAFGIGNMVQSNSVAHAVETSLGIAPWITGLLLAGVTFAVIIGGLKRIARVTERIVPLMATVYVVGALAIVLLHLDKVGSAFELIFAGAFSGTAAGGGFAGAGVAAAIRFGVARGVFSNEAGLGSAPIAHAAARTNSPVRQGIIGMLGTFIDTICVCTLTGLVILVTDAWQGGATGAQLSAQAFHTGLPGPGDFVVTFGLIFFAFSTILAWSYYGEVALEFLLGRRATRPYRYLWVVAVAVGAMVELDLVWALADVMNGLMILPNLIALIVLSPVVFRLARAHFANPRNLTPEPGLGEKTQVR